MSERNFKDLLIGNIEKVAVGLAALIILVYLISLAASNTEAEKMKRETESLIAEIQDNQSNPELPDLIEVDFAGNVKAPFKEVPQAGAEPQWFAFKKPYVVRKAQFVHPKQPVHGKPAITAKADVGQITLSWTDSPDNQNVVIEGYDLRRKEGEDDWLKLMDFGPDTQEYVDKTVRPDTTYSYSVTSRAKPEDTKVQFPDPEKNSDPVAVATPFNMEFDTKRMFWAGEVDDPKAKLAVKVTYLKAGDEKVSASVTLQRGQKIIVKDIETGWLLKDFGEKVLGPGKREKFIVIVNSEGKSKQFPQEESSTPEEPEEPGEEDKDNGDETPSDGDESPPDTPGDPGGGWLPPK